MNPDAAAIAPRSPFATAALSAFAAQYLHGYGTSTVGNCHTHWHHCYCRCDREASMATVYHPPRPATIVSSTHVDAYTAPHRTHRTHRTYYPAPHAPYRTHAPVHVERDHSQYYQRKPHPPLRHAGVIISPPQEGAHQWRAPERIPDDGIRSMPRACQRRAMRQKAAGFKEDWLWIDSARRPTSHHKLHHTMAHHQLHTEHARARALSLGSLLSLHPRVNRSCVLVRTTRTPGTMYCTAPSSS